MKRSDSRVVNMMDVRKDMQLMAFVRHRSQMDLAGSFMHTDGNNDNWRQYLQSCGEKKA